MGLRAWLRSRRERADRPEQDERSGSSRQAAAAASGGAASAAGNGCVDVDAAARDADAWREVPAYVPVDPAEHVAACVIASAIAAGDRPASALRIRRVSCANLEYRRVACIATALAAATHGSSALQVKRIFVQESKEDSHAA